MSTKRTIVLRGPFEYYEWEAASAITPGDCIMLDSAGKAARNSVATANLPRAPIFAIENSLMGDTIDTDYAAGDTVRAAHVGSGGRVNPRLAASQTIAKGDYLAPDATGKFIKLNGGTSAGAMLMATEAVTTGAGATARIDAQVL